MGLWFCDHPHPSHGSEPHLWLLVCLRGRLCLVQCQRIEQFSLYFTHRDIKGVVQFWYCPKKVLKRSSLTHPSLQLIWLERGTYEKNSYLQVPGSIQAANRELKSMWIWHYSLLSKRSKLLFPLMKANTIKSILTTTNPSTLETDSLREIMAKRHVSDPVCGCVPATLGLLHFWEDLNLVPIVMGGFRTFCY